MAFMMPVVKNEWDIYKTNRSRRSSECSNPQACRSRKQGLGRHSYQIVLLPLEIRRPSHRDTTCARTKNRLSTSVPSTQQYNKCNNNFPISAPSARRTSNTPKSQSPHISSTYYTFRPPITIRTKLIKQQIKTLTSQIRVNRLERFKHIPTITRSHLN